MKDLAAALDQHAANRRKNHNEISHCTGVDCADEVNAILQAITNTVPAEGLDEYGHFPDCTRWAGYSDCSCGRRGYDRFIARGGRP